LFLINSVREPLINSVRKPLNMLLCFISKVPSSDSQQHLSHAFTCIISALKTLKCFYTKVYIGIIIIWEIHACNSCLYPLLLSHSFRTCRCENCILLTDDTTTSFLVNLVVIFQPVIKTYPVFSHGQDAVRDLWE